MLLPLLAAAIAAPPVPPAQVGAQATATIRVVQGVAATRRTWEQSSQLRRREVIVRGEQGQPVLLRLIEFE